LTKKRENFRPFFGDGTSTNKKKKEIAGGGAEKKCVLHMPLPHLEEAEK
jgi:hypothetical protein